MLIFPERWKSLRTRYQEERPHRMLALDGGGIRGLITLGILEKIEKLVKDKTGGKLCDYFDYIGGTSTGAIIAAGLARGMTTADLMEFYSSCGKQMFDPAWLVERIKYLYTSDPLKAKLQEVFGPTTTLEPDNLKCLLLIVTKNVTTDSPWPISSNPDAKYQEPDRETKHKGIALRQARSHLMHGLKACIRQYLMLEPLLVACRVRLHLPFGLVVGPFRFSADPQLHKCLDPIANVCTVV